MKLSFTLCSSALLLSCTAAVVVAEEEAGGCFPGGNSPFHRDDWMYCQEIVSVSESGLGEEAGQGLYMYYTPLEDTVMMGLHVTSNAKGWSSLAIAGNGGMKGASQIVVRQDEDGEWIAEDRYSFDYVTPTLDEKQDVQLLFAQQDDETGETAWGVVIPQNSCDEPYDYPLQDKSIFMLWALGSSHDFFYHAQRGTFTANLMGPPPTTTDLDDYDYFDLQMPNVSMVRGENDLDPTNPFICSYFDMEELGKELGYSSDDKIHMVGYNPILTPGNEQFIHHLTLYTCEGYVSVGGDGRQAEGGYTPLDDSDLTHHKVIPACTNMPPGCTNYIAGWAVGADAGAFPEDVGIPIGEGQRWMVMQMHYYNPRLVEGVFDSSGVRISVSKDLRPIDAGIMSFNVGTVTGQVPPLPGGLKDVAMAALYVEPDCTKEWTEPLTVIDVSHHSHFKGLHQSIIVERDGVNLGPMRKEFAFDYNHQSSVQPETALRTLYPGDRFTATCHFDTSSVEADSEVAIGEESNKEMCFPTFFYYPKQERTSFMYWSPSAITPWSIGEPTWCSTEATNDTFPSLCAEKLYDSVPGFYPYVFNLLFNYSGPDFTYPDLCNDDSNETAQLLTVLPICPTDCEGPCAEELLLKWAQGVCEYACTSIGMSLYPNLTKTEPYSGVNLGCPVTMFDTPTIPDPPACQVKGSLPIEIELTTGSGGSSGETNETGTDSDGDISVSEEEGENPAEPAEAASDVSEEEGENPAEPAEAASDEKDFKVPSGGSMIASSSWSFTMAGFSMFLVVLLLVQA